jgi:hypothetical protein
MTGILILSLAVAQQGPEPPRIAFEGDAWYVVPSGWIFITRGSRPGTATRARQGDQFKLDPELLPAGDVQFRLWDASAIGFRVLPAEESGSHAASSDFVYHGETYAAGRQVRAEVGFLLMDLDFQYAWKAGEDLTVTPHLGAEYWGFSSRLRTADSLPQIDERRSFSSGYGLAGVDLAARLSERLSLKVSFLGGATGADRYFMEARAGLEFRALDFLSIDLGGRFHELRFHTSTNEANVLFYGPSAGITLRF